MPTQPITSREQKTCGHLFPRDEPGIKDPDGCTKTDGHYDAHSFLGQDGRRVEWEYDLDCNCGCMDSDTFEDCCIIYRHV